MVIDIHGKAMAVVEQPEPKSANEQQVNTGWAAGDGMSDQSLQPVSLV